MTYLFSYVPAVLSLSLFRTFLFLRLSEIFKLLSNRPISFSMSKYASFIFSHRLYCLNPGVFSLLYVQYWCNMSQLVIGDKCRPHDMSCRHEVTFLVLPRNCGHYSLSSVRSLAAAAASSIHHCHLPLIAFCAMRGREGGTGPGRTVQDAEPVSRSSGYVNHGPRSSVASVQTWVQIQKRND